jgi:hypothetical protein
MYIQGRNWHSGTLHESFIAIITSKSIVIIILAKVNAGSYSGHETANSFFYMKIQCCRGPRFLPLS